VRAGRPSYVSKDVVSGLEKRLRKKLEMEKEEGT